MRATTANVMSTRLSQIQSDGEECAVILAGDLGYVKKKALVLLIMVSQPVVMIHCALIGVLVNRNNVNIRK